MKKDPAIFLFHILESIEDAESFIKNVSTVEDFIQDRKTYFAVTRAIEIIGEASKNLPKEAKEKYKNVPWKEIAGTRNRLIHEYFGVDLKLMFKIAKEELPMLKKQIEKILEDLKIKKLL